MPAPSAASKTLNRLCPAAPSTTTTTAITTTSTGQAYPLTGRRKLSPGNLHDFIFRIFLCVFAFAIVVVVAFAFIYIYFIL